MTFARVDHVISLLATLGKHSLNWLDGFARVELIPHCVNIATFRAEIHLHVNDNKGSVGGSQLSIVGPIVGIAFDVLGHDMFILATATEDTTRKSSAKLFEPSMICRRTTGPLDSFCFYASVDLR